MIRIPKIPLLILAAIVVLGCASTREGLYVPPPKDTSPPGLDPVVIHYAPALTCAKNERVRRGYPALATCITVIVDHTHRLQNADGEGAGGLVPARSEKVASQTLKLMGARTINRSEGFENILRELRVRVDGALPDTNIKGVLEPFEICFEGQFTAVGIVIGKGGRIAIGGVGVKGSKAGARVEGDYEIYSLDGESWVNFSAYKFIVSKQVGGDMARFLPFPDPVNLLLVDAEVLVGVRDDTGIASRMLNVISTFGSWTEFYDIYECDHLTHGALNRTRPTDPDYRPPIERYLEKKRRQPVVVQEPVPSTVPPAEETVEKVVYLRSPAGKVAIDPAHQYKIEQIKDDVAGGCKIVRIIGFTCPKGEPMANVRLRERRSKHTASLLPTDTYTKVTAATDDELARLHGKPEWDNEHGSFVEMECPSTQQGLPRS